jgi:hypothetical protein
VSRDLYHSDKLPGWQAGAVQELPGGRAGLTARHAGRGVALRLETTFNRVLRADPARQLVQPYQGAGGRQGGAQPEALLRVLGSAGSATGDAQEVRRAVGGAPGWLRPACAQGILRCCAGPSVGPERVGGAGGGGAGW